MKFIDIYYVHYACYIAADAEWRLWLRHEHATARNRRSRLGVSRNPKPNTARCLWQI